MEFFFSTTMEVYSGHRWSFFQHYDGGLFRTQMEFFSALRWRFIQDTDGGFVIDT